MGLRDRIILKEEHFFDGSVAQLHNKLGKLNKPASTGFSSKRLDQNTYLLKANLSIGTLRFYFGGNDFDFQRISGQVKISQLEKGKQHIQFTTKVRIEIFVSTAIVIVGIYIFALSIGPKALFGLVLGPIPVLWFWLAYRWQERRLFNKLVAHLSK